MLLNFVQMDTNTSAANIKCGFKILWMWMFGYCGEKGRLIDLSYSKGFWKI